MAHMTSSSPLRVAAVGLGFVLAAWSSTPGCGSGGTTTTSSSGSGGGTGGSGTGGGVSGTTGSGGHFTSCKTCLDTTCAAEETACDADCIAIQACLDAVCFNLSASALPDEGKCQVHCQMLHPGAKAAHLALVNCVQSSPCQPPCAGYSFDYDTCVTQVTKGSCKTAVDACTASTDCTTYEACISSCATLTECLACATVTGGDAGQTLYEAEEACIETICIAPGWLHNL
jgi:hypothetical protein